MAETGRNRRLSTGLSSSTATATIAVDGKGVIGYVTVDAGKEYVVDKVLVDLCHDWGGQNLVVELSLTEDFANPVTVYDNRAGSEYTADESVAVSSVLYNKANAGITFNFSPVKARYIRVTDNTVGNGKAQGYTTIGEIQMFAVSGVSYVYSDTTGRVKDGIAKLYATEEGSEIYYTTDGGAPTKNSLKYANGIEVNGTAKVRAIAYKDGKYGCPADFVFTGSKQFVSKNAALGKSAKVYHPDGSDAVVSNHNGGQTLACVTDGIMNAENSVITDSVAFVQVDLGESVWINKAILNLWHDHVWRSVTVQLSDDETFATGVQTIFCSDYGNWAGLASYVGSLDETWADKTNVEWIAGHTAAKGFEFNFAPIKGRYIRALAQDGGGAPVEIFEDLQIPESSHRSGVYVGPQKISLMTGDKGATIYYTTDGSYPEPGSENTKKYDGTLIEIGKYDETATYSVRAVSVRGTDVSGILDIDLIIANASRNAASGKIVKLLSVDLTREVGFEGFNGASSDLRHVTDGSFDPFSSVIKTSEPAWAVLDLGEALTLDKFTFSFWHDWWFGKNELKVATKEDLSDAKRIWYEDAMQNVPGSGTTITLDEPVSARYVMLYNDCKGEGQCSMFTELQAYTAYGAGENLIADTENWTSLKNGDFTNDGKTIKENTPYQRDNWDKAYSYNAKTYKNFMLDATMKLEVSDPGAWGYAGFTIFREDTNVTQSQNGKGLTIGIEPKGRVLLWNGSREVGPLDANIVGWSVNGTFDIKIVAYEGTISVAINGRPVMNVYNSEYVGKEGYISLHSGLLPITVTKLGITEIDESFAFPKKGAAVSAADDIKLAIERYVAEKDVIGALGTTVGITDTNGKKHTVGVEWKADGYDRTKTGNFDFIGVLSADDLKAAGVSNVYNVKAYATVFIRSEIDDSVSKNLLSVAASLNENEYTAESWEYLRLKVEAMNSILNNKFLVQSDVNVGMFQLYDAIYKYLVYAGDTAELDEAIAGAEALDKTAYTDYSYADFDKVLKEAKEYAAQSLKTFAGIKAQTENLAKAEKKLVKKSSVVPVFDGEKPEIKDIAADSGKKGCSSSAGGLGVTAALGAAAAAVIKRKKRDE